VPLTAAKNSINYSITHLFTPNCPGLATTFCRKIEPGFHLDTAAMGFHPSGALGRYARGAIAQLRVVAEQAGLRL
jgi:hypothetical protein